MRRGCAVLLGGLLASGCGSEGAPAPSREMRTVVRVDAQSTLREFDRPALGLNTNYLMDGTTRPGARGLAAGLAEIRARHLRYPGGEEADSFLWSVPPFSQAQPTLARTGAEEFPAGSRFTAADNATFVVDVLDFDEVMETAQKVGASVNVVVCFDSLYRSATPGGTAPTKSQLLATAREWVRYANVRRGFAVRDWEIGNESFQQTYNGGAPSAEVYARDLVDFSRAMKSVDPAIRIGASGNTREWWRTVLGIAGSEIDFLAVHDYPTYAWTEGYEHYRSQDADLTGQAQVAMAALASDALPADRDRLRIAMTEVGAHDFAPGGWANRNDLGHAVVLFDLIGRHLELPRVDYVEFWNTRWIHSGVASPPEDFDALGADDTLLPAGRALAIWGEFLGGRMVAVAGGPVRAFASADDDARTLSVFLLNRDRAPAPVEVRVSGFSASAALEAWSLQGSGPDDLDPAWARRDPPTRVASGLELTLAPVSVTVVRLGN
jgi:alpha-L-arabinofuranosidase